MKLLALTALLGLAAIITPREATAQSISSSMIIDALTPEQTGPIVRSMSTERKRGINITGQLPSDIDLPKVALTINFDLDSARLTNDGMIALRSLAKALVDPRLAAMTFQIAGHTDGRGDAAYNRRLSDLRARTVVTHLINFYEISRDRLVPIGYGVSRPLDSNDLLNPVNRRVEIVNIAPLS